MRTLIAAMIGGFAMLALLPAIAAEKPEERRTSDGYHLHDGPRAAPELVSAIARADVELFDAVFNRCDAAKLAQMVSDDLEFFHDKDGLSETSGAKFVADIKSHCDRVKQGIDFRARRELVKDSMAVYPLNNYGAIETGVHRFYKLTPGQPDQLTEVGRFTHVWKNDNGRWKLARVLSYDHRLAD
jgi:ketosteroid isomerase-like protein